MKNTIIHKFDIYRPLVFDKAYEDSLSHTERLGLAYCRLNHWEWDETVGPKPEGFDDMPNYTKRPFLPFIKRKPCKEMYITPVINGVKRIIGDAACSWAHFKFNEHKTYDEWQRWYMASDEEKMDMARQEVLAELAESEKRNEDSGQ